MEKIYYKKTLVGIRISKLQKGTVPATPRGEPLQLLMLKHPAGSYLRAHFHIPRKRVTHRLQECLMVKRGEIRVDLYGPDHKPFRRISLKEGELFILLRGGYGIHIKKDAELIEAKNGPFKEDKILINE